jgi:hypothetical protein
MGFWTFGYQCFTIILSLRDTVRYGLFILTLFHLGILPKGRSPDIMVIKNKQKLSPVGTTH